MAYGAMAFTVKKMIEQSPIMREQKDTVIGGATNAALYTTARPFVTSNAPAAGTAFVVGGLEKTSDKTQNEVKEKVIGTLVVAGGGKVIGYIEAGAQTMRVIGNLVWWLP